MSKICSFTLLLFSLLFFSCESPTSENSGSGGGIPKDPVESVDDSVTIEGTINARITQNSDEIRMEVELDTNWQNLEVHFFIKLPDEEWTLFKRYNYSISEPSWVTQLYYLQTGSARCRIELVKRGDDNSTILIGSYEKPVNLNVDYTLTPTVENRRVKLAMLRGESNSHYRLFHSRDGYSWDVIFDSTLSTINSFYDLVDESGDHYYRSNRRSPEGIVETSPTVKVTVPESAFDFPIDLRVNKEKVTTHIPFSLRGARNFEFYRSGDGVKWEKEAASVAPASFSYELKDKEKMYFQVRAVSGSGKKIYSTIDSASIGILELNFKSYSNDHLTVHWKDESAEDTIYYYVYHSRDSLNWTLSPSRDDDSYSVLATNTDYYADSSKGIYLLGEYGKHYVKAHKVHKGVTTYSKVYSTEFRPNGSSYTSVNKDLFSVEVSGYSTWKEYTPDLQMILYRSKFPEDFEAIDTIEFLDTLSSGSQWSFTYEDTLTEEGNYLYAASQYSVSTGFESELGRKSLVTFTPVSNKPEFFSGRSYHFFNYLDIRSYFIELEDSIVIYRSSDGGALTAHDTIGISRVERDYEYSYRDSAVVDSVTYTYAAALLTADGVLGEMGESFESFYDGRYDAPEIELTHAGSKGVRISYSSDDLKSGCTLYLYRSEGDNSPVVYDSLTYRNSSDSYFIDSLGEDLKTYNYQVSLIYREKVSFKSEIVKWKYNGTFRAPAVTSADDKGDYVEIKILSDEIKGWRVAVQREFNGSTAIVDTVDGSGNGLITFMDYPGESGTYTYSASLVSGSGTALGFGSSKSVSYTKE